MNRSIRTLLSKSTPVSARLGAAKDTERELLRVFENDAKRERVLKHFEALLHTLSRVSDDVDVSEATCRILGILGSIPQHDSKNYHVFMNWVESVKDKLSYFHVLVETFVNHGGNATARLVRVATKSINQNIRSVLRLLCMHNNILSRYDGKDENMFSGVLESIEFNELKRSGHVDIQSKLMKSYVIAAAATTKTTTTPSKSNTISPTIPTKLMNQDLKRFEENSNENRAILFNLRLIFNSALHDQVVKSRDVLSYVTTCLLVATRHNSHDIVLMCLKNIISSFHDDTIRTYILTTRQLLRAVQVTLRNDSFCSATLNLLYVWFQRKIVPCSQELEKIIWKLLSSSNETIRKKAAQILPVIMTRGPRNAKQVEILAILCSGDSCSEVRDAASAVLLLQYRDDDDVDDDDDDDDNNIDIEQSSSSSLNRIHWKRLNLLKLIHLYNHHTFDEDRKLNEVHMFLKILLENKDRDDDNIIVSLPRGMSMMSRRNHTIRRWCETWTSALVCVQRRLRTQYGKAADLFEKLENSAIIQNKKKRNSNSSMYLLEFMDMMEKMMFVAHTGTLFQGNENDIFPIRYVVPSQNCSKYFKKNRDVCDYWMCRIQHHLQHLSMRSGALVYTARYGLLQLDSNLAQSKDFSTLRFLVESLYRMGDTDTLLGVKTFLQDKIFDEKFVSFDEKFVNAILHMSQGHFEIASELLISLLLEKQTRNDTEIRQFLATRLIECASHSRDVSKLEYVWKMIRDDMEFDLSSIVSLESFILSESSSKNTETIPDLSLWQKQNKTKLRNISILGITSSKIESVEDLRIVKDKTLSIMSNVHCSRVVPKDIPKQVQNVYLARKRLNFDLARRLLKEAQKEIHKEAYIFESAMLEYETNSESRVSTMLKLWNLISVSRYDETKIQLDVSSTLVQSSLRLAKWLSLISEDDLELLRKDNKEIKIESCLKYAESYSTHESMSFSLRSKIRLAHWHFENQEDFTNALTLYAKALQIGECSVDDEILGMLRILQILSKENKKQEDVLSLVPVQPWLRIVPQLFARLQKSNGLTSLNKNIRNLVSRICAYAPHRIIYNLCAALCDNKTSDTLSILEHQLEQNNMLRGVKVLSRELERITLLWEERWMLKLRDVSKDIQTRWKALHHEALRLKQSKSMHDSEKVRVFKDKFELKMKPVADAFQNIANITIETQAETFHEIMFMKRYQDDARHVLKSLQSVSDDVASELVLNHEVVTENNDDDDEMNDDNDYVIVKEDEENAEDDNDISKRTRHRVWKYLHRLYRRLRDRVQKNHTLGLSMKALSTCLSSWSSRGGETVPVPTNSKNVVYISRFLDNVDALDTKTKPKRIRVLGSDGTRHSFLLKGTEDLRLDERVMQLLSISNDLYDRHDETASRSLRARHYAVTPLSRKSGLIQWIDGVVSLFKISESRFLRQSVMAEKKKREKKTWNPAKQFHDILKLKTKLSRSECSEQVIRDVFTELQRKTPKDLLSSEIWLSSTDTFEWWFKRRTYSQSLAVMSMLGYVIGLGDRHLDNILLDFSSGEILHIDYNVCFDKGLRLRVPECVPFRLTKSIRHALGVTQTAGTFERACVMTMRVLRRHQKLLLALMETFAYDPIIDWTRNISRKKNNLEFRSSCSKDEEEEKKRKDGENAYAIEMLKRIKSRLKGEVMEQDMKTKLSVETQVNKLIRHAESKKYLCRMYEGWAAWV